MRAARYFAAVDSHTEGMPTRVITGGAGVIPGETMAEKRLNFLKNHDLVERFSFATPDQGGHGATIAADDFAFVP